MARGSRQSGKLGGRVKKALEHRQKHGNESPEFEDAKQYVEGAKEFTNIPPAGSLVKGRPNADSSFYDPATFAAADATGVPRTMFRPSNGMGYWNGL